MDISTIHDEQQYYFLCMPEIGQPGKDLQSCSNWSLNYQREPLVMLIGARRLRVAT